MNQVNLYLLLFVVFIYCFYLLLYLLLFVVFVSMLNSFSVINICPTFVTCFQSIYQIYLRVEIHQVRSQKWLFINFLLLEAVLQLKYRE